MPASDVPSALRAFLEVQVCRAQLYTRFHEGFQRFLKTRQEPQYKGVMAELTTAFNECSKRVIALEATLKELGRADLAAWLRQVQEAEREKLRLTLTLQALKQAAAFRTFSWQRQPRARGDGGCGGDDVYDVDDDEALALLDPEYAASRHSCGHAHGHGHDHGHACQRPGVAEEGSAPGTAAADKPASLTAAAAVTAAAAAEGASQPGPVVGNSCEGTEAQGPDGGFLAEASSAAGGVVLSNGSSCTDGRAGGPGAAMGGTQNSGGGGVHGHGCGCNGDTAAAAAAAAPGPTRREYEAAVKEAMQGLDACVRKINEVIGDVRIELEDA